MNLEGISIREYNGMIEVINPNTNVVYEVLSLISSISLMLGGIFFFLLGKVDSETPIDEVIADLPSLFIGGLPSLVLIILGSFIAMNTTAIIVLILLKHQSGTYDIDRFQLYLNFIHIFAIVVFPIFLSSKNIVTTIYIISSFWFLKNHLLLRQTTLRTTFYSDNNRRAESIIEFSPIYFYGFEQSYTFGTNDNHAIKYTVLKRVHGAPLSEGISGKGYLNISYQEYKNELDSGKIGSYSLQLIHDDIKNGDIVENRNIGVSIVTCKQIENIEKLKNYLSDTIELEYTDFTIKQL